MAVSFNSATQLKIGKAVKQLVPDRSDSNISACGGSETWRCAFSPDGRYFAWSVGYRIVTLLPCTKLIRKDKKSTTPKQSISIDCGHLVRSVTFASIPNLRKSTAFWLRNTRDKELFLVTGHNNGRLRVWDIPDAENPGKLLLELLDHKDAVSDVAVSATGALLASSSFDGTIKIWDLIDEGNLHNTLKVDGKPVYSITWAPNCQFLASCGMSKIANIWNADDFTISLQLIGHQHNVVAVAVSPDSCLVATASWDTRVIVWDSSNGNKLKEFFHLYPPPRQIYASGENGCWIRAVSFSSDGAHIASVADDGLVRLWDLLEQDGPETVFPTEEGLCCTFAPSGNLLAVGTRTGAINFFETSRCIKSLLFQCRIAIRKNASLTNQLKHAIIPQRLKDYLNYHEWE